MALRAMRAFGLQCRLVKSIEIAHGALLGKSGKTTVLLVPGGNARLKSLALGHEGRKALRDWVSAGGLYLGFCGGAGLALSHEDPDEGLGICPWSRAGYSRRLYHMLSGHVLATDSEHNILHLPVWWPGRFAHEPASNIQVLAQYLAPSEDLWLSDLPLARIPANILRIWENTRGLAPGMDFPSGQPLIISGSHGRGKYILSYAHLETPQSIEANTLLAHILHDFCGLNPTRPSVPPWKIESQAREVCSVNYNINEAMNKTLESMLRVIHLAIDLRLFFPRTPWLLGWRAGQPGMACNNLLAALHYLSESKPSQRALNLWKKQQKNFTELATRFFNLAETFFWETRLEKTLESTITETSISGDLHAKHTELFGHPMLGGGFIENLLGPLEEMIYLSARE